MDPYEIRAESAVPSSEARQGKQFEVSRDHSPRGRYIRPTLLQRGVGIKGEQRFGVDRKPEILWRPIIAWSAQQGCDWRVDRAAARRADLGVAKTGQRADPTDFDRRS